MRIHRSEFFAVVIFGGLVWLVAFYVMDRMTPNHHINLSERATLARHSTWQVANARPIPLYQKPVSRPPSEILRLGIRAKRIGSEGGTLTCGPAQLVVPRHAVAQDAFFCLEDFSVREPVVELETHGAKLVAPTHLMISYGGTLYDNAGFDPAHLKMYREISLGVFETIPSRVDQREQYVIADVTKSGRYVIG